MRQKLLLFVGLLTHGIFVRVMWTYKQQFISSRDSFCFHISRKYFPYTWARHTHPLTHARAYTWRSGKNISDICSIYYIYIILRSATKRKLCSCKPYGKLQRFHSKFSGFSMVSMQCIVQHWWAALSLVVSHK